jgi:hypothetical protein
VDSFRDSSGSKSGCANCVAKVRSHPLFGSRKAVIFGLASPPNSATFHTKSRRYLGPVKTRYPKEIRPPTFLRNIYPLTLYAMIFLAIWILQPLLHLAPLGSVNHSAITIISFAVGVVIAGFLRRSIGRRAPARQGRVEALMDATRLGEIASAQAQRLLVIRAIDDEASLTMALGAVFTYVTARAISYILGVFSVLALIFFFISLWVEWHSTTLVVGFTALTMMLLGPLAAARTVHGWGLALSPMECQINTQSTPDAKGLSAIVTLVRRTYVKSLRHGIYDHEDCAKTISDWVRSQLCMPHEVGVEGNSVYRTGIAN